MKSNLELMQNVVKPYIDAKNQALTNKLEDEASARAKLGAHNFLKTTITSQTKNGITLTVNSDGSITVSTEAGGATETTVFNVCEGYSLEAGTYIYSGVPATGSSTSTYYLDMRTDTSSQFIIDSSRPAREITTAGQSGNDARLIIMSGVVITTPIVFKPMIRLATDADPTYQPYAKTNVELTQDVAGLAMAKFISFDNLITTTADANECVVPNGKGIKLFHGNYSSSYVNFPSGFTGGLLAVIADGNFQWQLCSDYSAEVGAEALYFRKKYGDSWSDWKNLTNA